MDLHILQYVSDLIASNTWVIEEDGFSLVVDPARDLTPGVGIKVEKILLTHEHYDHISGVNEWKNSTGASVLCTAACAEGIGDANKNLAHIFPAFCQLQTWVALDEIPETDRGYTCSADETFDDSLTFDWRGHAFSLFALPGHSPGGCGILVDGEAFFSGDSLLPDQEVQLRLPGGDRTSWEKISLPRLRALPDGITVYPGHFDPFIYHH